MDESSLRQRMERFLVARSGIGRTVPAIRSLPTPPTVPGPAAVAAPDRESRTPYPPEARLGRCPPRPGWPRRLRSQGLRQGGVPGEGSYDEIFRRVEQALRGAREQIRCEVAQAAAHWERLRPHPQPRRLLQVENDRRLHTWGLFDYLIEHARAAPESEALQGIELAQLALVVAEHLPADLYGEERLADFRCAALIELGNGLRRAGHLDGARRALCQARVQLELGTGDLLDWANLTHRLFELLRDQGDLEGSFLALEQAKTLFRRLGDDRLRKVTLFPVRGGVAAGGGPESQAPETEWEVRRPVG